MAGSNVGPTKVVLSPHLRKFDLLPTCFRLYFKDAYADFDFEFVQRNLNRAKKALGRPLTDEELASGLDRLRAADREMLGIEAFAVYGPEHPQATPVLRTELRRRGLIKIFDEGEEWRRAQRERTAPKESKQPPDQSRITKTGNRQDNENLGKSGGSDGARTRDL